MECPSCDAALSKDQAKCSSCGFQYDALLDYYGSTPKTIRLMSDESGVLTIRQQKKAKKKQQAFGKKIQGSFFCLHFESTSDHDEADSKSLWLLNHAEIIDLSPETLRSDGFLLFVDLEKKSCVLSYGLGVSEYFSKEDAFRCISAGYNDFYRSRYLEASMAVMKRVMSTLTRRCPF